MTQVIPITQNRTKNKTGDFHKQEIKFDIKRLQNACNEVCLLYTSPSPRDMRRSRMPSSA